MRGGEKIKIDINIKSPVVLYVCRTWSPILRGEHRLMVLKRILWPKREGVTGDWRKIRYEELQDLYSSPNTIRVIKSRRMRWAKHVACMGENRNSYRICLGSLKNRHYSEDLGIDVRIILK